MGKYRKLSHTTYKCEYHIVWTPKYRFRVLKDGIASEITRDIYGLSSMKEVIIEELNVQPDHIHLYCSIPRKLSISSYMGFLKGKTAIKILGCSSNCRTSIFYIFKYSLKQF
jgi:putative transposase